MAEADLVPSRPLQVLDALPGAGAALLRAAVTAVRRPRGTPQIKPAGVCVRAVVAEPEQLAAYRRVCGLRSAATLPLTYPHVMGETLQLWLMSRPEFPLPMLGLVHLANRFEQIEPIAAQRRIDLAVWFGNSEVTHRGLEFEVVTEASGSDGRRLWIGVSTYLYRMRSARPAATHKPAPVPKLDRREPVDATADVGRRYARVSGDFNPIHLYAATARLFGFRRAIAHGMWSAARCLGALEEAHGLSAQRMELRFRSPLLLPAMCELRSRCDNDSVEFVLAGHHDRLYLEGTLGRL
ncbi:MAG: hypothetical protein EPN72_04620 [Nevskiaceae bacterium]|nr:MAG: hypothetical protein EPN63_07400 [Nevskiaceae bacterium]TBR74085.1 MAG: hypothetical protein EPN72_04620 [Nevskiaceae bacterium]